MARRLYRIESYSNDTAISKSVPDVHAKYRILETVGEGTYGQVFKAQDRATGEYVALKKIKRRDGEDEGIPISTVREIRALARMEFQNVVKLHEIVRGTDGHILQDDLFLVFEWVDHDLTGLMERTHRKFTQPEIKLFLKQLLQGVIYLHSNQVLHRDLKPANLLVSSTGNLKIADFGLAKCFDTADDFTNNVITFWYRPLELFLGERKYGTEVDMWSVGCVFADMLLGRPLFNGASEIDHTDKLLSILGFPTEDTFPGCSSLPYLKRFNSEKYGANKLRETCRKYMAARWQLEEDKVENNENLRLGLDLLEGLLALNPKKRLTALEAWKHPYLWTAPLPCEPAQLKLPRECSHELAMVAKRKAEDARMHEQMKLVVPPSKLCKVAFGPSQQPLRSQPPAGKLQRPNFARTDEKGQGQPFNAPKRLSALQPSQSAAPPGRHGYQPLSYSYFPQVQGPFVFRPGIPQLHNSQAPRPRSITKSPRRGHKSKSKSKKGLNYDAPSWMDQRR